MSFLHVVIESVLHEAHWRAYGPRQIATLPIPSQKE
jgi:hypothetical protein